MRQENRSTCGCVSSGAGAVPQHRPQIGARRSDADKAHQLAVNLRHNVLVKCVKRIAQHAVVCRRVLVQFLSIDLRSEPGGVMLTKPTNWPSIFATMYSLNASRESLNMRLCVVGCWCSSSA